MSRLARVERVERVDDRSGIRETKPESPRQTSW